MQKNIIFFQPIDKFLKGYLFEKSASSLEKGFYVWRFIQPLYLLADRFILSYGERLRSKKNHQFWTNEDLLSDDDLIKILSANQSELLRISGPDVFVNDLMSNEELNIRQQETLAYSAHYVDDQLCTNNLRSLIERIKQENFQPKWMIEVAENAAEFLIMTHAEREELLAKNREQSAENLGLTKFLSTL